MGAIRKGCLDTALDRAKRERRIARGILAGKKPGLVARLEGVTIAEVTAAVAKWAPQRAEQVP